MPVEYKKVRKIAGIIIGTLGLIIIIITIFPIANYFSLAKHSFPDLVSPIENRNQHSNNNGVDYTKASNWFEGDKGDSKFSKSGISYYTIDIPSLSIEGATVSIGGDDLSENLIHYPGTSLPGKNGNSVIFGHSILPIFFNPKDYLSIFSTLPTIDKGEEIIIKYDGVVYRYLVESKFEVQPTDIQILEQNKSDSFLTLVTCTPPGDPRKPKRLIVRAKIYWEK